MSESTDGVRARTLSGVRWAIIFNVATIPLSFVTNLVLGRLSPFALGQFSAIQIFVGGFLALFLPGGRDVFVRIVPRLEASRRASFLATYTVIVAVGVGLGWVALREFAPVAAARLLEPFGVPGGRFVLPFLAILVVWSIASFFLYATLNGPKASFTLRVVVVAFFLVALSAAGPLRPAFDRDPVTFLWWGAVFAYGLGAVCGAALTLATVEIRSRPPIRWILPRGLWSAVAYTHLGTVITFLYTNLSPALVLVWLDRESLARIHVPLRYAVLLNALPLVSSPVVSSAVARLDAHGERDRGLRNAATAMRGSTLLVAPVAFGLVLFAPDAMAIFNPEFRQHADLLRWIVPSALAGPVVHLGVGLATALGAFRSYAIASSLFVVVAVALNVVLVPRFGVVGAAIAIPIAALTHQTALTLVLRRRLGFTVPGRIGAAWAIAAILAIVTTFVDPSRWVASALFVVALLAFARAGRVSRGEIESLTLRFLGRAGS